MTGASGAKQMLGRTPMPRLSCFAPLGFEFGFAFVQGLQSQFPAMQLNAKLID